MIELRALTPNNGEDVFEMIQEIGEGENGFVNSLNTEEFSQFKQLLIRNDEISKGINLEPHYVPQTIFWLYVDGKPVGYGKLRSYLNEALRNHGGHVGYVIRPSERQKGYGKIMLEEIVKKAKERDMDKLLVTCDEVNIASRKIIEANGGKLDEIKNDSCFYWIYLQ